MFVVPVLVVPVVGVEVGEDVELGAEGVALLSSPVAPVVAPCALPALCPCAPCPCAALCEAPSVLLCAPCAAPCAPCALPCVLGSCALGFSALGFSALGFAVFPEPALDSAPAEDVEAEDAVVLPAGAAFGVKGALFAEGVGALAVEAADALAVVVTLCSFAGLVPQNQYSKQLVLRLKAAYFHLA